MALSLAAAGIGAIGSIGGALLGGKKDGKVKLSRAQKRLAGAAELEQQKAILRGEMAAGMAQKQLAASEAARIGLFNRLGDVGTYEESYEDYAARTRGAAEFATGASIGGPGGLFKTVTERDKVKGTFQYVADVSEGQAVPYKSVGRDFSVQLEGQMLDVPEFMKQATDSRQFRMLSKLTAEADQLIRKEGPLWDEFNASIVGSIYEQSGALHRENMKQISDNLARGGTARRAGVAAIEAMRAAENTNRMRTEAVWQSKLAIDQWARDNAANVMQMNMAYVDNLGGLRDNYNQMMTNITMFHGTGIMPTQVSAANASIDNYTKLAGIAAMERDHQSGVSDILTGLSMNLFGAGLKGILGGGGGTTLSPSGMGPTRGIA